MLIVFEGIDGSGKTAVIEAVKARLADMGVDCEATSEFNRPEDWSVQAKKKFEDARNTREELNHVVGVRVIHAERILEPLLAQGVIVLMDRYLMSTMAYQASETISEGWLLHQHCSLRLPQPDITFLIDVASETAKQRTSHRQDQSKIDQRPLSFFDETRARYRRAAQKLKAIGWDVQMISGELPLAIIADEIAGGLLDKILGVQVTA